MVQDGEQFIYSDGWYVLQQERSGKGLEYSRQVCNILYVRL